MNMYIGNLAFTVTEDDLKDLFTPYGEIVGVNIITDEFSRQPKGFAFIEMPNNSEADKAIKALNGSELKGKNIKVNQAEPGRKRRNKSRGRRF